uniref:RING-type E3 ubiquitin transferase n=2 Tax=Triticum urartu TaxID=4572 RepID=A0A8R7K2J0_TRIUA
MVGTGTERGEDGSLKHYPDVALRLRVPSPPTLADPFVTGSLEGGSGLGTFRLRAYAEGDDYRYGSERAACSPSPPKHPDRESLRALRGDNSACSHLTQQLMTSYSLEHGGALIPWMRVNQMRCTTDGAAVHVRAYAVLFNDTRATERRRYYRRRRHSLVREEAVVADGHWDSDRRMLCFKACRVALPVPSSAPAVQEHGCGIGMSFWFPAVWTMRERSIVSGMLWNSTNAGSGLIHGVITASSIDDQISSTNLSDVKYSYNATVLGEARKHYLEISKGKKVTGSYSFPDFNCTVSDFAFRFDGLDIWSGEAYPVTIGSVMLASERLAADDAFFQHTVAVEDKEPGLLNVSYTIRYTAPPDNWVRPTNTLNYSVDYEKRKISAEGVYDPNRGILCMVGCKEHNGSTDCQTLVTVQFASLDSKAQGHGTGVISSLRDKTDRLFFEKVDFTSYGMYSSQVFEAVSRMDMESVLLLASTTLSCVFIILQILHTKRNLEAAAATSITMLTVVTMGYLAPLALNSEALFPSRRSQYYDFYYSTSRRLEMNEVMMRAPTLIAFVLQLRLLQLAWSGRRTSTVSERTVLWICLPLYALGGALAAIIHGINARAMSGDPSMISMGEGPATIWEDLVSYVGLVLDGFLLPQVILNAALGGSRARAISPWFYIGGTMVRVAPHVYDVVRAHLYKPSMYSSHLYASPRGDLFSMAWEVVIPCGAVLLALLLFMQQRLEGTASLPSQRRRSGGYEMVSNI